MRCQDKEERLLMDYSETKLLICHAWTQHVSEVLKALSKGKSKDICICNVTLIQFSLEIKIKESVKVYPDRIVFAEDP